jgi:hypothetical protein
MALQYLGLALILAAISGLGSLGSFILYPVVLFASSPVFDNLFLAWFPYLITCIQWVFIGLQDVYPYAKVGIFNIMTIGPLELILIYSMAIWFICGKEKTPTDSRPA